MYENKGAFALVLGSGLSRPAGILSGWDIGQDMIRKAMTVAGVSEGNPDEWFQAEFGVPPTYSNILKHMVPREGERAGALRAYIEPSGDDAVEGRKVPTDAHRAIADMVARGYVRVIITPNFDPLLEQALDSINVPYQVVASADDVAGMVPLMLHNCTIIKVNGDYRDSRIRNIEEELTAYDPQIEGLIRQVLGDLGLVVCGWSSKWDPALSNLVRDCRSSKYATYWTHRSSPTSDAAALVEAREGHFVKIGDADGFFRELDEALAALEQRLGGQPLDATVIFETVKRYVSDDRFRPRLDDLVGRQTRALIANVPDRERPGRIHREQLPERLREYEIVSAPLIAALVAGCFWGGPQHARLWSETITQVATLPGNERGPTTIPDHRLYPALLLMYAGGIAAVASGRYQNLAAVLLRARVWNDIRSRQEIGPAVLGLRLGDVLSDEDQAFIGTTPTPWALNHHLREVLRPAFGSIYVHDAEFDEWFDTFEYLLRLEHLRQYKAVTDHFFAPHGELGLKGDRGKYRLRQIVAKLDAEAIFEQDDWGASRARLFSNVGEFQTLVREAGDPR
jgi:hypothetical protein